jgi:uncharacterized paraquat-inducible protein A
MSNKWKDWKSKNPEREAKVWDVINPYIENVSDEVYNKRMDICKSCEFLFKPTSQCKKCGCLMHLKSKLPNATCPIGKW